MMKYLNRMWAGLAGWILIANIMNANGANDLPKRVKKAGPDDDGFCGLLGLHYISDPTEPKGSAKSQVIGRRGYSQLAVQQLAVDHFNTRNNAIVKELSNLIPQECTVHFPESAMLIDSHESTIIKTTGILEYTYVKDWNMCGIIGTMPDRDLASTVGTVEVPYAAYAGDDAAWKSEHVAQMYIEAKELAAEMVVYLDQVWSIEYVGVLNGGAKPEKLFTGNFREAAEKKKIQVSEYNLIGLGDSDPEKRIASYKRGLEHLRDNGYRAILTFVKDKTELEEIRIAASMLGMDGDDYLYMFNQDSLDLLNFELAEPELSFLEGSAFFALLDKFEVVGPSDPFLSAWSGVDARWKQRLDSISPFKIDDDDFFQTAAPALGSSLIYDAVMALGIAACQLQNYTWQLENTMPVQGANVSSSRAAGFSGGTLGGSQQNYSWIHNYTWYLENSTMVQGANGSSSAAGSGDAALGGPPGAGTADGGGGFSGGPPDGSLDGDGGPDGRPGGAGGVPSDGGGAPNGGPPDGRPQTMTSFLTKLKFNGASSLVSFDNKKKRLATNGMYAGVYNIRRIKGGSLEKKVTSTFDQSVGLWQERTGEHFFFKGNNLSPPSCDLVAKDQNYLSTWVRVTGLTLYVLVSFMASLFLAAVLWMKKDATIRAAQPIYSMLLCAASLVTVQSILPLSLDEKITENAAALDASCMIAPWLFFLGLVMCYTVLFCKMWRLDKIMHFRKGLRILEVETMWPLAAMLLLTVAILIAWTVVDPWHWERDLVSFNPPTSYGQCESENLAAWLIPLCGIMIGSIILAVFAAWRTKKISNDFSDTSSVFYSITLQAQAWLVGLPTLALLGDGSVDATYIGRMILIVVASGSPLCLVLGPRLWIALRIRMNLSSGSVQESSVTQIRRASTVHVSGLRSSSLPSSAHGSSDICSQRYS